MMGAFDSELYALGYRFPAYEEPKPEPWTHFDIYWETHLDDEGFPIYTHKSFNTFEEAEAFYNRWRGIKCGLSKSYYT